MARHKKRPTGDYEVGYCRAPKQHQFQKGQPSPNPTGRRGKKQKDLTLESLLSKILEELISSKDGSRRMTTMELLLRRLVKQALSGDMAAMRLLSQLFEKSGLLSQPREVRGGVLVVPGLMTPEEWEKAAFEQQAPFRCNVGEQAEKDDQEFKH